MDILSKFQRHKPPVCALTALAAHNEAVCSDADKPHPRERERERDRVGGVGWGGGGVTEKEQRNLKKENDKKNVTRLRSPHRQFRSEERG